MLAEVEDEVVDRENRGNGCGIRSVAGLAIFTLTPSKNHPLGVGGGVTIESLSIAGSRMHR